MFVLKLGIFQHFTKCLIFFLRILLGKIRLQYYIDSIECLIFFFFSIRACIFRVSIIFKKRHSSSILVLLEFILITRILNIFLKINIRTEINFFFFLFGFTMSLMNFFLFIHLQSFIFKQTLNL